MLDFIWNYLSTASTLEIVAVSVYIGAAFASIMLYINKTVIGKVVRKLIAFNAHDPESAKTLSELGLSKNIFIRSALKKQGSLRKLVSEVSDKSVELPDGSTYFTRDEAVNISSARFYIREEQRIRAELRYSSKGSDIVMLIISLLLFLVVAYVITLFIPFIIELFGDVTKI